jgi:hypothetical protein
MYKQCPICDVTIIDDVVHFSHGKPGTRERLYARVCHFALERGRKGCINQSVEESNITDEDGYDVFKPSNNYKFEDI